MGAALPTFVLNERKGFRLVNSKLPTIDLFDDVSSAEDFADLYDLQALSNPRMVKAAGDLAYINTGEIPWGIPGCSYAVAPFTHVSPDGSRFSNGEYGMLYVAETMKTAISEVAYHQQAYLSNVEDIAFDRLTFRGLACTFSGDVIHDATTLAADDPIYNPYSYADSQPAGGKLRADGSEGIQYWSVRSPGNICWGLFTPMHVSAIVQTAHFEFVTDGRDIIDIRQLSLPGEPVA
jgi:hypothetical protein